MVKKAKTKKKIVKTPKKKSLKKKVGVLRISKKTNEKTLTPKNKKKKNIEKVIKKTKSLKKKVRVFIKKKKVLKKIKVDEIKLHRSERNPIIEPTFYSWESQAVFNPAAVISDGVVHLFYRALGNDGISRIGYARSYDGINFEDRLSYPVYIAQSFEEAKNHWPFTSPARLSYDPIIYTSGGGWGGCEDPRTVIINGTVYMTFNMFNGWNSMRVAVVSIKEEDLKNKKWNWQNFSYLSRPGDRQKNWVLFPEKINDKFVLLCNLDKGDSNKVYVVYLSNLDASETPSQNEAPDPQLIPDHDVAWHYRTRSAACPPIKTKDGWLLLYHAMDRAEPNRYKVGAMLLDLKNPEKVLYRAQNPILEPDEWYENDYKPGIVYANGAVVKNGKLFVYYGGGDKRVAVASIFLDDLLNNLKNNKEIKLNKKNK